MYTTLYNHSGLDSVPEAPRCLVYVYAVEFMSLLLSLCLRFGTSPDLVLCTSLPILLLDFLALSNNTTLINYDINSNIVYRDIWSNSVSL